MPASRPRKGSCPACGQAAPHLLDWEYSGLGESVFNYTARFHACRSCGLVYVENVDDPTLARFYADECSYFEKPHFSVDDPANHEKYAFYASVLGGHGATGGDMADIGCGRGGFVNWLAAGGWQGRCCGIDVDTRSLCDLPNLPQNVSFRNGDVLNLPFADASLDLVTSFHVLEHIRNLRGVLNETARVLRPGGRFLIEVPDAERYATRPVGTAFWFSIREHINHFTAQALCAALNACGFHTEQVLRQVLPTPEFSYPSLMLMARKGTGTDCKLDTSPGDVAAFALESRQALRRQAETISALAPGEALAVWGCSAELFSLLPLLDPARIRLCDSSALKQTARYQGLPVQSPAALPIEGTLVVAPYLHATAIRNAALTLGWPAEAIYVLR
jgi:SAM-dependent methyltransferase